MALGVSAFGLLAQLALSAAAASFSYSYSFVYDSDAQSTILANYATGFIDYESAWVALEAVRFCTADGINRQVCALGAPQYVCEP